MTETWRRLALYLLLFGMTGMAAELLLLGHFEDAWQWTPIALLGVGLPLGGAVRFRPSRITVVGLRTLMLGYLIAGGIGLYLHLKSNIEFELELHPSMVGWELITETLSGAMPALAPGAMAQLGLLGLLVCFRHPGLSREQQA
ncbi:MAG: hypothetical protein IH968_12705 [Gemmatimonadetes bacterium]|nr:hypothetical protein [Gemmatimonadota bacterium]